MGLSADVKSIKDSLEIIAVESKKVSAASASIAESLKKIEEILGGDVTGIKVELGKETTH